MSKWFGKIGYAITGETEPGMWEEHTIVTRDYYYGDLISDKYRRQSSGNVNDDINLTSVISIIVDPFVYENCSHMAYAEIMGARWKITDIDVHPPRLKSYNRRCLQWEHGLNSQSKLEELLSSRGFYYHCSGLKETVKNGVPKLLLCTPK